MEKVIVRQGSRKPMDKAMGTKVERVISYSVQNPSSDFDRRPATGGTSYVGASKMESRNSKVNMGHGQSKKHKSSGKGQK